MKYPKTQQYGLHQHENGDWFVSDHTNEDVYMVGEFLSLEDAVDFLNNIVADQYKPVIEFNTSAS